LPRFEALAPDEILRSMDKLSFSEAVQVENGYRFRVIQNGSQFNRIYSERRVGKFLDEVLPRAFRDQALLLHNQVVVSRRPSFSFSMLRKADGPLIRYERLLLPFTPHREDVERIVAAINHLGIGGRLAPEFAPLSRSSPKKMDSMAMTC